MAFLYETYQDYLNPDLISDDAIKFYDNIDLNNSFFNVNTEDAKLDTFKPTDAQQFDINTVLTRENVHTIDENNLELFYSFVDSHSDKELIIGVDCEWIIDALQQNKKSYLSTIQIAFMLEST